MKVVFTEKELDDFRSFENKLKGQFGNTTYVGTNSATVLVNYSPELAAMLRPFPPGKHYEFVVRQLSCSKCKKREMFLCLETQTEYLCNNCVGNKPKSK